MVVDQARVDGVSILKNLFAAAGNGRWTTVRRAEENESVRTSCSPADHGLPEGIPEILANSFVLRDKKSSIWCSPGDSRFAQRDGLDSTQ